MATTIELNEQQQRAATFGCIIGTDATIADTTITEVSSKRGVDSGPLLIIAGAGTGKTNTLAHRAAHLIINGVSSERILLMTFSRRAANELAHRAQRIVSQTFKTSQTPQPINIPWVGTFHSVANRLLRLHGKSIGLDTGFSILDRDDAADQIDVLRHELGYTTLKKRFPKKATCLSIYSRCVNAQAPLKDIIETQFPWCADWQNELTQLYKRYVQIKIEQSCLDYDDLLLYWYYMTEEPQLVTTINQLFDHVLVDEYQDTNILQSQILLRLFPQGKGLTVVGDDAQSIYSFRSAEVENILQFPAHFTPPATVITLAQNYRSTQAILDLSNTLLAESKEGYQKTLISHQHYKGAAKPKLITVEDDKAQAQYIIEQLLQARESGTALRRQAVLFRSSHHSDKLEVELIRHDIPFVKYGGLKFLEAAHVKDMLCILRWADNPKHRLSGFRVLKLMTGVGPQTAQKALDYLELQQFSFLALQGFKPPNQCKEQWQTLLELLHSVHHHQTPWQGQADQIKQWYEKILEEIYDDAFVRIGDLEQLVEISQQSVSRERFLSELTLDPPTASSDLSQDPHLDDDFLILSTIHSAKGQEWTNVFILNVADGNFPNEFACGSDKAIEEERRLLYVGITRAKQNLHLIQPFKYWVPEQQRYGDRHVYGAKSRFLTTAVCDTLENTFFPLRYEEDSTPHSNLKLTVDVRKKLEAFWE
ncbi:MAG: ATP-dependent helicase [Pseudomonadales bacterium]|nr:ATP-dependent helicase [Pseudomonadales bacterium]